MLGIGERQEEAIRPDFNRSIFIDFASAKITSDAGFLLMREVDQRFGIKPEDQKRIFGKFEQIDSSYSREQEGTGLGLALTRKLVELHGGRVWVESEGAGKGSRFSFSLLIYASFNLSRAFADFYTSESRDQLSKRGYKEALEGRFRSVAAG